MSWIDWALLFVPLFIVFFSAWKSQRYVTGVADFLTAGRIAGRYVVSVANGEAGVGLISFVSLMEMYYRSGFAISFWGALTGLMSMILGLVGFCTYRFRETRAMTMGQFFEIRYNKSFRVVAAVIQSISGIVNYGIFPAVGGRFLVYFLDLPLYFNFLGITWSTYGVVMFTFLAVALCIACLGGQITIMVTDCIQGLLNYPFGVALVLFFIWRFSWTGEMAPTISNRPPGESFLNPYDTSSLRDFNIFYVLCGIVWVFLGRMAWGGQSGYNGAARNAHEAKIGALIGSFRNYFATMMFILMAVVGFTYLNHRNYAEDAREVRESLAQHILDDIMPESKLEGLSGDLRRELKADLSRKFAAIPVRTDFPDAPVKPLKENFATAEEFAAAEDKFAADLKAFKIANTDPYTETVFNSIDGSVADFTLPETMDGEAQAAFRESQKVLLKKEGQTFSTIYNQMLVTVAMKKMLPAGLTGIFCAMMFFMMLSSDTTYLHSWGSILIQDLVVPLRKKPFTPKQQLTALRIAITFVCLFAFIFSLYFSQIDYILMFFSITGAIWAGAGAVITFGLYWSKGTPAAAFASLFAGAIIAITGIVLQQTWASHIYPWLEASGNVEACNQILLTITRPFHPWIIWGNPDGPLSATKFPITSTEIGFICNSTCVLLYVVISLLTCRKPFNMDRMLHRGKYAIDEGLKNGNGEEIDLASLSPVHRIARFIMKNMIGIDKNYTTGDKCIAYFLFAYSFGFIFLACFVMVVIWNAIQPWDNQWWSWYFYVKMIAVSGIVGIIGTVWIGICGVKDLNQLFKDLETKKTNVLDDGRVEGNASVADQEINMKAEQNQ